MICGDGKLFNLNPKVNRYRNDEIVRQHSSDKYFRQLQLQLKFDRMDRGDVEVIGKLRKHDNV